MTSSDPSRTASSVSRKTAPLYSSQDEALPAPSLSWRAGSTFVMGTVGVLVRTFFHGLSRPTVTGLDGFTKLLDERKNVNERQRGLITVSNHVSIIDDPLMWGVLPYRFLFSPDTMRWGLGSHDLCYQNAFTSRFFMLGQVLPAHRSAYSQYGGLFQPSMTQAIRLLSSHPYNAASTYNDPEVQASRQREQIEQALGQSPMVDLTDPFTNGSLFYTTNHVDRHHNPSMYNTRRHAWVHIFPEGKIHQHEDKIMRYFKWGVSRLILESEPAPVFVPVYIEGMDHVYHEGRGFPRPLPRPGKDLAVTFGKAIETDDGEFGEMRKKWRDLVEREAKSDVEAGKYLGVLTENLKYSEEAVKLREECTLRVRDEIIKLRKSRGLPDEDPKNSLVATWREEGATGQREGQMADGSWIKDT